MAIQYKMMTDDNDFIYFVNRLTDEEYHIGDTIIKREKHYDDEIIKFDPVKETVIGFKMSSIYLPNTNCFYWVFAVTKNGNIHLNDVITI